MNLTTFYIWSIIEKVRFFMPVIIVYLLDCDFTMWEITTLQGVYFLSILLLEIPTGRAGDIFSRKIILITSSLSLLLGDILITYSSNFSVLIITQFLWGISSSLNSGTSQALLYDNLKASGKEHSFRKILGNLMSISIAIGALSNIAGGFLSEIDYKWCFILTLPFSVAHLALSFSIKDLRENLADKKAPRPSVRQSLKGIAKNRKLLTVILIGGAFLGMNNSLGVFYQPILKLSNLDLKLFGFAFFAFYLASAIGAKINAQAHKVLSDKTILICASFLLFVTSLLIGINCFYLPFLFLFLKIPFIGIARVSISTCINDIIASDERATILSYFSLFIGLVQLFFLQLMGFLSTFKSIHFAMLFYAGFALVFTGGIIAYWESSYKEKSKL